MKRGYTFALTLALALALGACGALRRTAHAADEPAPALESHVKSGSTNASARQRGTTSHLIGSKPIVR